jgi:hypothetical protein
VAGHARCSTPVRWLRLVEGSRTRAVNAMGAGKGEPGAYDFARQHRRTSAKRNVLTLDEARGMRAGPPPQSGRQILRAKAFTLQSKIWATEGDPKNVEQGGDCVARRAVAIGPGSTQCIRARSPPCGPAVQRLRGAPARCDPSSPSRATRRTARRSKRHGSSQVRSPALGVRRRGPAEIEWLRPVR